MSQQSVEPIACDTEPPVKFEILGPLEITVGSQRLDLGSARQQIVIATLLLSANKVVTMDRLLEAIYGEDLPPTSRAQAQICVSSLRRLFATHGLSGVIATRAHGYVIQVASRRLDAQCFEDLVATGHAARNEHDLDRAVANYRDALRLWRGPALDGIQSRIVRSAAIRLDEQRISATEDRIDLELDMGRHFELIGELTGLAAEFPLRERLHGQLMVALYRSGRTAEALQVYRRARHIMIAELGLEPSGHLQQIEHHVLTSHPVLDAPATPITVQKWHAPSLLPSGISDFTGRAEEMGEIRRHLIHDAGQEARVPVSVLVIVGKTGVGKTCLAVHAAHGAAAHYPDGQLFADLHGSSSASDPVSPAQVLERFLRVLGMPPAHIPEGLDERAEVYRSLLAGRKVLVVLDDATSESQVAPLFPGSGPAAVIITSRSRLAGLAGASQVELDIFTPAKSQELLTRIVGIDRTEAERQATVMVAGYCGHLPLALRIAGARLSARPHWSIQRLAGRLADEKRRLDELRHGDMSIRASILLTYESTSEQARTLFRRLALLNVSRFPGWVSPALLGQPLMDAEDLLDELVNAHLVEIGGSECGVQSQYRFHDLVRVFARERLVLEEPAVERPAAIERALGALLFIAEEARCRHYGGNYFGLHSDAKRWPLPERLVEDLVRDPLAWYARAGEMLVAGIRQAAQVGSVELCWNLALSAITLFDSGIYLDDWQETHAIALEAAQKAHHIRGQAALHYSLGSLHIAQQRFDRARQALATAARLFTDIGDEQGILLAAECMAFVDRQIGSLPQSGVPQAR
jgi:DNA-binding SARP family transcriptional activator